MQYLLKGERELARQNEKETSGGSAKMNVMSEHKDVCVEE